MTANRASPCRIVVTGSECTGKTTLAAQLAARFGLPWIPEASRLHAEHVLAAEGRELTAADVEPIARLHLAAEERALADGAQTVILDADLLSTVVYAAHYYGSCPAWIAPAAQQHLGDLYLLNHPDVPWIGDGVRDRPDERAELHSRFAEQLRAWGASTVDVRGPWETRWATAEAAVERLLPLPVPVQITCPPGSAP